jgi:uncharacterized protein (TIGR03435 family)
MLQWLLVERFGLVAHGETRSMPALALVVGKGGPKMKPAAADAGGPAGANHIRTVRDILDALMGADPGPLGAIAVSASGGGLHMEFAKMPMDALAMVIAAYLRGPVLDMTGLAGEYQVTLDFSRDDLNAATAPDAPGTAAEPSGASVYSSVQQLGLRLERRKAPVALLVVDRVERVPKEN